MAKEKFELARLTLARDNVVGVRLVVMTAGLALLAWTVSVRRVVLRGARAIIRR